MAEPTTLELGLFAPTLTEQGFSALLSPQDLAKFEECDKAISRLHVHNLITYSAHVSAREKLAKQIKVAVSKYRRLAAGAV